MKLTRRGFILGLTAMVSSSLLVTCRPSTSTSLSTPEPAAQLTITGWAGYMPQSVLDAFTAEYNIKVRYVIYGDTEEAMVGMRKGEVYDVVVLDDVSVQIAAQEKLLAELDPRKLSNFNQIANDFRDLAFDPKNKYSIPFEWGTSGLLYRNDLVDPPTRWADLWNPSFTGKIGLWPYERDVVGMTLKSLGFSYNSEDAKELAQAGERLMELRDRVVILDPLQASGVPQLLNGDLQIIFGWAYDMQVAAESTKNITYVIPAEGSIIWLDNLAIPANSADKEAGELFLNFILRPKIAAQIANEMYVAMPNEGANPYIDPELLHNRLIFPTAADLAGAEFYAFIGPEAQATYHDIWLRFSAGPLKTIF